MSDDLQAVLGGALAGALATVPMSAVMLAAEKAGLMGRQPPEIVTNAAIDAVGAAPTEGERTSATVAAHFAFGAVAGSVYALMQRRLGLTGVPIVPGIGFGLAVYTVSYAGWIPAMHLMPAPPDDRPGRPSSMIAAHIVFGAALALFTSLLLPNTDGAAS